MAERSPGVHKLDAEVVKWLPWSACHVGAALVLKLNNRVAKLIVTKVTHCLANDVYSRDIWVRQMSKDEASYHSD